MGQNVFRYKEDGHCKGEPEFDQLPSPTRLQWDIPEKVQCNITNYQINKMIIMASPVTQRREITSNLHACSLNFSPQGLCNVY